MRYLFILGRNIELSIAELKSFFRKNSWDFKQIGLNGNGLLVDTESIVEKGAIENLGGTISIGKVLAEGKELFSKLDKINLHNASKNKLNYAIYNFASEDFGDIEGYLKKRFKEEKLKTTKKNITGNVKIQEGGSASKVSSNLIDEKYFVFEDSFGRIMESSDYSKIEKRDMEKPIRRNELAISPRLAKIMINLSEVKKGETLLDPFCGIGVILEEALIQGIKVIGIDKDENAVRDAKKNLEWFNFKKEDYNLINADSSGVRLKSGMKVSGIAAEPNLGKLQKKALSNDEAKKILAGFEKLMIHVLNNLKKYVNGKVVFTAPLILTKDKKRIECDFEKIARATGLKILGKPISEFREGQIVGRSICILER